MTMCYIARETCGCVTVAIVDRPEHKRETAKELGKCIRDGMTVERMDVEEARKLDFGCRCKERQEVLL